MLDDNGMLRAAKFDTATISDALNRLAIVGQCLGIKPRDHCFRMAGRAFTVLYESLGSPPGTIGDYIDDVPPSGVVVLARER